MYSCSQLRAPLCLVLFAIVGASLALSGEQLIDAQATLPVLDYVDSPEFLESLRTKAVPVLLRNTPAQTRWSALKSWVPVGTNPSTFYLSKVSERTVGVKRNSSPKFPIGCCPLVPMTQKEFWIALTGLPEGQYMYFNADLSVLDPVLRSDLHPQFFSVSRASSSTSDKTITNVWMGSKGSTAALHHDPFDNFFVQIYGRKKFTLFSPDLHHSFYVYPKTHPASRQAQVNIDEPDERRFPKLSGIIANNIDDDDHSSSSANSDEKGSLAHGNRGVTVNEKTVRGALESGIEIVVKPGDVLYLPPFWFHQVEALDTAISVNTWFDSPDVEIMDAAWSEPLPFSADWSDEGFALGLKLMIHELVNKVLGHPKDTRQQAEALTRSFIQDLVDTRFKPLYGEDPDKESDLLKGIKTTDDPHLRVHLREQTELDASTFISKEALPELTSICAIPTSELLEGDPEFEKALKNGVRAIARHFMAVEKRSGFQIMHLEDFVEDLIGQAVGDKSVYHFLASCFLQDDDLKHENSVRF